MLKDSSGNGHDGKIVGAKWVRVDEELGVVEDDPDRRAAEWVLGIGGEVIVKTDQDFGWQQVNDVSNLPEGNLRLVSINLLNNANVSDADLAIVRTVPTLHGLRLQGTRITDVGIEHLGVFHDLVGLSLNGTQISDGALTVLSKLPQLESLYLSRTSISNSAIAVLRDFPKLMTIDLYHTKVTEVGIAEISRLSKLVALRIGPDVTPLSLKSLRTLPGLRMFALCSTRMTGPIMEQLKEMGELEVLFLQDTGITDAGLSGLRAAIPQTQIQIGEDLGREFSREEGNLRKRIEEENQATGAVTGTTPPPAIAPFDADQAKKHQQVWADYLDVPVERDFDLGDGVKLTMVLIPPGEFMMGSTVEEQKRFLKEAEAAKDKRSIEKIPSEGPQHRVRITKPFFLGHNEVTRGQFRQFVKGTQYKTDAERDGKGGMGRVNDEPVQDPRFIWSADVGFAQTDDDPVVNVSWNDATAFCQWLSTKQNTVKIVLPSEAQWEYACRAGTMTFWHCGDGETSLQKSAWFSSNRGWKTHPVGQLQGNAWGLYDMHGNVWEWCDDRYGFDYYSKSSADDPAGPSTGSLRVHRGGCWYSSARGCRSADRDGSVPSRRDGLLGFRVAADLPSK